ncbi:hypothetical protein BC941DRAFT_440343 [Chlamydoabsidia padenii]|nr:hypothetical protein BC941DRAFT_440343 [Chlamydoabsidia padenii]
MSPNAITTANANNMEVDVNDAGLNKAIFMVNTLKEKAEEAQDIADEAMINGTSEEDADKLTDVANVKWARYHTTVANNAKRYPLEPAFFVGQAPAAGLAAIGVPAAVTTIVEKKSSGPAMADLPFLLAAREKTAHPKAMVKKNAREFTVVFEEVMVMNEMNADEDYHRYLPRILSKSYKNYLDTKRKALGPEEKESWTLIKEWLIEFTNTPKQRVKNVIEWLELTPYDDESGEEFFFRVQEAAEDFEIEKNSLSTLAFFSIYKNLGSTWRNNIHDAIRDGKQPFVNKSFAEMCSLASDLQLNPRSRHDQENKKRRYENVRNDQGKNVSSSPPDVPKSRGAGPFGKYPGGGIYCDRGCGMQYHPAHPSECPVTNKPGPSTVGRPSQHHHHHRPQHQRQGYGHKTYIRPVPTSRAASAYIARVKKDDEERQLSSLFKGQAQVTDKLPCKSNKRKELKKDEYTLKDEINVPLYLETEPILALVDSGANFSSVNKRFCLC